MLGRGSLSDSCKDEGQKTELKKHLVLHLTRLQLQHHFFQHGLFSVLSQRLFQILMLTIMFS